MIFLGNLHCREGFFFRSSNNSTAVVLPTESIQPCWILSNTILLKLPATHTGNSEVRPKEVSFQQSSCLDNIQKRHLWISYVSSFWDLWGMSLSWVSWDSVLPSGDNILISRQLQQNSCFPYLCQIERVPPLKQVLSCLNRETCFAVKRALNQNEWKN